MPYSRPTLTELRDQVVQDINAAQISNNAGTLLAGLLQFAILRVLAYAFAGLSYEHYGYLDWVSKQAIPWTCTDEFLEGWAALKGVYREQATPATATVTLNGAPALVVPYNTGLVRADGAVFFTTVAGTIGVGGTLAVPIQASLAGSADTTPVGAVLALANPIAGVQAQGTVTAAGVAGVDLEVDTSLRTRMLAAYAAPPQGGDRQDYTEWATAVAGVTRAWVAPNAMGAGTVNVFVMLDAAEAAYNGFPQGLNGVAANEIRATAATGDQLAVANAIYAEQPVTALVYVTAPTAQPINFAVANLGANNTATMQAAITAALQDLFLRVGNVGGTINPETGAAWPAIDPSEWYAALNAIAALTQYTITAPTAPIVANSGALPVLGTVTFSA